MTATEPEADPWASSVVLGNGDTAFIRSLTTNDKAALLAFHERQSSESVYRRYFSPKPTLSEKELEHFTNVDMVNRVALAVESQNEFVAWASYERLPGRPEAEAAFMVDDEHHGRGIATLLLEHLAAIARTNGIDRFTAEVLGDNRGMLAVFAKAGWPLQRRFESGVVDLDWELATTDEFLDSVERREQRSDSRAVARILLPRAVAVIGASDRVGTVGNALWRNVVNSVDVPVHAVNPRLDEIDGHPCHRTVEHLPDDVSLAIIAVPQQELHETIDACIQKRMRGAIIVTDTESAPPDFNLAGLVTRSRRNGLRLIGPSSMGVASLGSAASMQAAIVDISLPPGNVAVSMQSGVLGSSLLRRASDLGLGLSWFVSLGDKSDISANDLLQFWEDDDTTKVVAMYTESFGNPRKFARIARRVSLKRPIIAVRSGAAADANLGSALYRRAGLIEVPSVSDLLDTARLFATQPILRGPNVAVISNSRSPAILAVGALRTAGLAPIESNISLGWAATAHDFDQAIRDALRSPDIDGLLVVHAPAIESAFGETAAAIAAAGTKSTKPVVAVVLGNVDGPVTPGSEVPAFGFPEEAAAVLGRSYAYAQWLATEAEEPDDVARPVDPIAAQNIVSDALATVAPGTSVALDLATQRRLLATYSIEMAEALEATPATAVQQAQALGYPVAVKAVHRRVGRSAESGVALDLTDDTDIEVAVAKMAESLGADADELVVQSMASPGLDIRIRCQLDERLGAIVSVGVGGVQADMIDDRTARLAPVSPSTAMAMLREARLAAALEDADIDASVLVDVIVQAAQLAAEHPDVTQLDLNPVIVGVDEAVVTDATIVVLAHDRVDAPIRRIE